MHPNWFMTKIISEMCFSKIFSEMIQQAGAYSINLGEAPKPKECSKPEVKFDSCLRKLHNQKYYQLKNMSHFNVLSFSFHASVIKCPCLKNIKRIPNMRAHFQIILDFAKSKERVNPITWSLGVYYMHANNNMARSQIYKNLPKLL